MEDQKSKVYTVFRFKFALLKILASQGLFENLSGNKIDVSFTSTFEGRKHIAKGVDTVQI